MMQHKTYKTMTEQTETNLRTFMRRCQQFWTTQWLNVRQKDGTRRPTKVSYEQSLIGVYADMTGSVIDKPCVYFATPGDVITESDCCRVFNTEFSDSWESAKKHYTPGGIFSSPVIPNYRPENKE